ncbi:hypothetical protein CLV95_1099 [Leptospira borgpetersenii serovar Javanica]|nr:hypothetical protein CLV95_1099 [Leptospira borgpetersenii serovar Javanica]
MGQASDWYEKRFFDIEELSITLIAPIPFDVTAGLILEDKFLKIQKEDPKLVKYKVGIGGEVLTNKEFKRSPFA